MLLKLYLYFSSEMEAVFGAGNPKGEIIMLNMALVDSVVRQAEKVVRQEFVLAHPLETEGKIHPADLIGRNAIAATYCQASAAASAFNVVHLEEAAKILTCKTGGVNIKLMPNGDAILNVVSNQKLTIKVEKLARSGLMTLLRSWAAEKIRTQNQPDDLKIEIYPSVEIISSPKECEAFLAFYKAEEWEEASVVAPAEKEDGYDV